MKTFTRILLLLFLLGVYSLGHAAKYTLVVHKTHCEPAALTINKGDTVVFQWMAGAHTISAVGKTAAWLAFPLNSTNQQKELAAPFKTAGSYQFSSPSGASGTITVQQAATVKELKPLVSIDAFPNPASGQVQFSWQATGYPNARIRITNMIGKTVRTLHAEEAAAKSLSADLSDLPAGIYLYSLVVNDKLLETKRLIVKK